MKKDQGDFYEFSVTIQGPCENIDSPSIQAEHGFGPQEPLSFFFFDPSGTCLDHEVSPTKLVKSILSFLYRIVLYGKIQFDASLTPANT